MDGMSRICSLRASGLGFMAFLSNHYFTITFERAVALAGSSRRLSRVLSSPPWKRSRRTTICQSITRIRNSRSKASDNGRESSSLPITIYLIIDIFLRLPLKSIAICTNTYQTMHGHKTFLVICNPTTRQVLHFPKVKTRRLDVWSMFDYDPIDKQFKVLCMTRLRNGRDFQESIKFWH